MPLQDLFFSSCLHGLGVVVPISSLQVPFCLYRLGFADYRLEEVQMAYFPVEKILISERKRGWKVLTIVVRKQVSGIDASASREFSLSTSCHQLPNTYLQVGVCRYW
jgi:hypothetical protein